MNIPPRCRAIGLLLGIALLLCSGCPRESDTPKHDPSAPCKRAGDRCTHSPGKLGVCGQVDDLSCEKPPCFTCSSQH